MPPQAGEQVLVTLFADVHYFISPPSQRPPHHRFEKGSYVYLYHSPSAPAGRLEIANNAGTADQDAFEGSLANASMTYSYRQPNLVTFAVMRRSAEPGEMWQLKSYDASQAKEYLYLLNTLDIYFWKSEDAESFVEQCRGVRVGAIDILDESVQKRAQRGQQEHDQQARLAQGHNQPRPRDSGSMSPVVQKLEQAAIGGQSYAGHAQSQSQSSSQSFPPPPPVQQRGSQSASPGSAAAAPAPLAYNPAAPPAPEPIAHREKTPPPVDSQAGTGLGTAAKYDVAQQSYAQGYPYSQHQQQPQPQQYHQQPTSQYTSPAPQSFPPPPPSQGTPPGPQRTGSFPPPPPSTSSPHSQSFSPPPTTSTPPYQPQRTSALPFQKYASPPTSPGLPTSAPPYTSPLSSPIFSPPPPSHYNPAATAPPPHPHAAPAYSNTQYAAQAYAPAAHQDIPDPASIHATAYRPSEAELGAHGGKAHGGGGANKKYAGLEQRASNVEKGVNRFLKRLDKGW